MPTHLGGLQDRVKQESSRFPKPQQASLDENEPKRASQFDSVIDKEKETSNYGTCRFVPRQFQDMWPWDSQWSKEIDYKINS
jgi:hypothetical protein